MSLLAELRDTLGDVAILAGSDIGQRYVSDKSETGRNRPLAVVRPRTNSEVSTVLRICNAKRAPVVVQGGMTGLAGGANS